jgi:hypothetical protein
MPCLSARTPARLRTARALQGRFSVWGTTAQGASVLLRLHNHQPYFVIAAPRRQVESGGLGGVDEPTLVDEDIDWHPQQLQWLQVRLAEGAEMASRPAGCGWAGSKADGQPSRA